MFLLFKSNIMMMILMWSNNIGFELSARMAFPGNFQPLKVQLFSARSAPNRRVSHFIAYAEAERRVMRELCVAPLDYTQMSFHR